MAIKACESVEGLKGFVGVDLKINTDNEHIYDVYFLELNSRFTTPYVGLKQIVNFNIGKSIIEMIDGKIDIGDIDVSLDGVVEFKKLKNSLNIRRL